MKYFRLCDSTKQEQKPVFIPFRHIDDKLLEKLLQEHRGELKQR
jgi:hypothetical protein